MRRQSGHKGGPGGGLGPWGMIGAIMGGLATLVAFGAPRLCISHRVRRSHLR